jgi:hypothetical protein
MKVEISKSKLAFLLQGDDPLHRNKDGISYPSEEGVNLYEEAPGGSDKKPHEESGPKYNEKALESILDSFLEMPPDKDDMN